MGESFRVPTREEHRRFIRRIWVLCISFAFVIFIGTGTTTFILWMAGYETEEILRVSTTVFQILILSYGMGFFVPAFLTSLIKMSLGVEMSREGLQIGQQTAGILTELKRDLAPILSDLKTIVADIKPVVHDAKEVFEDFKKQDYGKAREALDRIVTELDGEGSGKFNRLVDSLERIAKKVDAKADDAIEDLLGEAWGEEANPAKADPEDPGAAEGIDDQPEA